jgi:glycosyltransferase involved in cell wall biosynthesis
MRQSPSLKEEKNPLVSVCIFNYNYGKYLRQCIQSVIDQTYANIEICFSDNASSDDSWGIALEYAGRYPEIMTITRNRKNFGSDANFANCYLNVRGKYYIELCSDDALQPSCVSRCVQAIEAWPNAGYVMVHRSIMDESGIITEEAPFYNRSCLIPGDEQAAVYMMAAVNPSISQVMYRRLMSSGKSSPGGIATRWYGTRLKDFNMCCEFPMIYLDEPLLLHRVHSLSDSFRAAESMMEIIGPYLLLHQFAEIALQRDLKKVAERLPMAIEKLGKLSMRYCARAICAGNAQVAKKYYYLALSIEPELSADENFGKIRDFLENSTAAKSELAAMIRKEADLICRRISYDPPEGSMPIC